MTPEQRIELYLNRIITGSGEIPKTPENRIEQYLNRIATGSGTIPLVPETRFEKYLNRLALDVGEVPEKPETKLEFYLNYAIFKTGELPTPTSRIENLYYQVATKETGKNYYGKIFYYPVNACYNAEFYDGCEIKSVDAEKLDTWLEAHDIPKDMLDFDYSEETWRCMGEEIEDIEETGIDVTLNEGSTWAFFMLRGNYEPDMTKEQKVYLVDTEEKYNVLSGYVDENYTMSDAVIPRNGIIRFIFGDLATVAPKSFLIECEYMEEVVMGENLTEVGINFLASSYRLCEPIDLSRLKKVGTCFMATCKVFNHPIDVSNIEVMGVGFMTNCESFNQPLIFSSLTDIDSTDLSGIVNTLFYEWASFNSEIKIPKLQKYTGPYASCYTYLMGQCPVFDGSFEIPATFTTNQGYVIPFAYMGKSATLVVNTSGVGANLTSSCTKYVCATTVSTAESYTKGIKIAGTYASEFKSRFPDKTSAPTYRKLVLA